LFGSAVRSFRKAASVELPLDGVAEIADAIDFLREVFQLEVGSTPGEEEFEAMMNYCLVMSGVPGLYSLAKYFEFFAGDLPSEAALLDGRQAAALKVLVERVTALGQIASEM
jgi:hypothetical protein